MECLRSLGHLTSALERQPNVARLIAYHVWGSYRGVQWFHDKDCTFYGAGLEKSYQTHVQDTIAAVPMLCRHADPPMGTNPSHPVV